MARNRFVAHSAFLHRLCDSKTKAVTRKKLINKATGEQIRSICELCLNLNNLNIPVTCKQRRKLLPYKTSILKLAAKKPSIKIRKKFLNQSGGFLPILGTVVRALVLLAPTLWPRK